MNTGVSSQPDDDISWREEEKGGKLERRTENEEVSELHRSSLARQKNCTLKKGHKTQNRGMSAGRRMKIWRKKYHCNKILL